MSIALRGMPGSQIFPVNGMVPCYVQCLLLALAIAFQVPPEQAVFHAVGWAKQSYGALTGFEVGNSVGGNLLMADCQGCGRELQ